MITCARADARKAPRCGVRAHPSPAPIVRCGGRFADLSASWLKALALPRTERMLSETRAEAAKESLLDLISNQDGARANIRASGVLDLVAGVLHASDLVVAVS